jgi:hypothetical protein
MKPVTEKQHNLLTSALEKSSQKINTAPRELSDEEIDTIREALLMIGFQDAFINYHLKEEALAILKKASEK